MPTFLKIKKVEKPFFHQNIKRSLTEKMIMWYSAPLSNFEIVVSFCIYVLSNHFSNQINNHMGKCITTNGRWTCVHSIPIDSLLCPTLGYIFLFHLVSLFISKTIYMGKEKKYLTAPIFKNAKMIYTIINWCY